jgi:hypothetical protein
MKKLIGLVVMIMMFIGFGCTSGTTTLKKTESKEKYQGFNVWVYEFDGCEYVKFPSYNATWGAHKGNCKNPIHNQQKRVDIKFYDMDGSYRGTCSIDSVVISYKTRKVCCWSQGRIAFESVLKDIGITMVDIKK